jgi:hypothetical protein
MSGQGLVIQLEGDEQAQRLLEALQSAGFLKGVMQDVARQAVASIKVYPPQRPNTDYIRTNTLTRRWTYEVRSTLYGATAVIGNNTSYAPYVQSAERQSWVHEGWGWVTDEEEIARAETYVPPMVYDAIEVVLRTHGAT